MATICATVCSGNARDLIGDAIRSVPWADLVLVIDSGITDDTLDIAREAAGGRLRVVQRSVEEFMADPEWFASQRNFGLKEAAKLGTDWACILDTDERLVLPDDLDIHATLDETPAEAMTLYYRGHAYAKVRFIKLPSKAWFHGKVHEAFLVDGAGELPGYFWELPGHKTREIREQDIRGLLLDCEREPLCPRWPYYLGQTYRILDEHEKAIEAYRKCWELNGWDEEGAMACVWAADSSVRLGKLEQALDWCTMGLRRHSGMPELYWLAASCEFRLGRWNNAAYWAIACINLGRYKGMGISIRRLGMCIPEAHYSGPYNILRMALLKAGEMRGAVTAHKEWLRAKEVQQRESPEMEDAGESAA